MAAVCFEKMASVCCSYKSYNAHDILVVLELIISESFLFHLFSAVILSVNLDELCLSHGLLLFSLILDWRLVLDIY